MTCEQIGELLPDYLRGGVTGEQNQLVEHHLRQCEDCGDEVAVALKLSQLPFELPSEASRQRVQAMLLGYRTGRGDRATGFRREPDGSGWSLSSWLWGPGRTVAWGVALLVVGVFAGSYYAGTRTAVKPPSDEIAAISKELAGMRQLLVLSMLQQQSASERLEGVNYSQRADHLDPQVLAALVHTLRYDSSVDVRLAALDVLNQHAGQPQVHEGVMGALRERQSPLVQVALIDAMLEWRGPDVAETLRTFERTPDLNPTVKQRAEWALSKLN
jgi:hypothetical protein